MLHDFGATLLIIAVILLLVGSAYFVAEAP